MLFPKATHLVRVEFGIDWGHPKDVAAVSHFEVGEDGMLYQCEPPNRIHELRDFRSRHKTFKLGVAIFGWVTLAASIALVILEGGWL